MLSTWAAALRHPHTRLASVAGLAGLAVYYAAAGDWPHAALAVGALLGFYHGPAPAPPSAPPGEGPFTLHFPGVLLVALACALPLAAAPAPLPKPVPTFSGTTWHYQWAGTDYWLAFTKNRFEDRDRDGALYWCGTWALDGRDLVLTNDGNGFAGIVIRFSPDKGSWRAVTSAAGSANGGWARDCTLTRLPRGK